MNSCISVNCLTCLNNSLTTISESLTISGASEPIDCNNKLGSYIGQGVCNVDPIGKDRIVKYASLMFSVFQAIDWHSKFAFSLRIPSVFCISSDLQT